jgi:hypothetical protein
MGLWVASGEGVVKVSGCSLGVRFWIFEDLESRCMDGGRGWEDGENRGDTRPCK